ncbi:uncharacterized protein TRIADDRAFT_62927, partial [Trichoplax adhaerens]
MSGDVHQKKSCRCILDPLHRSVMDKIVKNQSFYTDLKMGLSYLDEEFHLKFFSENANAVFVRIYNEKVEQEFPLEHHHPYWTISLKNIPENSEYLMRCEGPYEIQNGHRFSPKTLFLDPYAKELNAYTKRALFKEPDSFDWEQISKPLHPKNSLIIYEAHLRGLTMKSSLAKQDCGTFKGLIYHIDHLIELGINAIELQPIFYFDMEEVKNTHPETQETLKNYWGYNSRSFFTLTPTYGTLNDFKNLVKECHKRRIEVILDVVYNHSPGLMPADNSAYYIVEPYGAYANYTGCGNTISCNHPETAQLILDSLEYFSNECQVDGFRFDLASILTRGEDGSVLEDPLVLKKIRESKELSTCKLIAEAWDAAGLYQLGQFKKWGAWSEWNGQFRDHIRSFIKGDRGLSEAFEESFNGSTNLYDHQDQSINFITSHDGFTLMDLVCFNEKHNEANGESNRD